jgi:hypothetical protein
MVVVFVRVGVSVGGSVGGDHGDPEIGVSAAVDEQLVQSGDVMNEIALEDGLVPHAAYQDAVVPCARHGGACFARLAGCAFEDEMGDVEDHGWRLWIDDCGLRMGRGSGGLEAALREKTGGEAGEVGREIGIVEQAGGGTRKGGALDLADGGLAETGMAGILGESDRARRRGLAGALGDLQGKSGGLELEVCEFGEHGVDQFVSVRRERRSCSASAAEWKWEAA